MHFELKYIIVTLALTLPHMKLIRKSLETYNTIQNRLRERNSTVSVI